MPTIYNLSGSIVEVDLGGPGSGFFGHAGRDAENKRGGSVKRGEEDGENDSYPRPDDIIPVSQVSPNGKSLIPSLKDGVKTKSVDAGITGHGFRYMGRKEFQKFKNGELKYGGEAQNEMERGVMFANAPGDFFYGGGSKEIYLIEVNVQGTAGGLLAPKNSVGLKNVVGAWYYEPKSKTFFNLIK